MSRVIHFEIPADNPERAVDFYKKVFGWNFQKWGGPQEYWLVSTGPDTQPGINGGLLRRQHPGAGTCNTIGVASVDQAVANVTQNGGKTVMPKTPIPGVGYLAYCSDTEGNVFGMMQPDQTAK
ncbi:MAG TPA: VOC family protein [Candidatus Limnocylindria bacterium]|nr:VOC family protein [Candidatus Limnocylindria bacterium]